MPRKTDKLSPAFLAEVAVDAQAEQHAAESAVAVGVPVPETVTPPADAEETVDQRKVREAIEAQREWDDAGKMTADAKVRVIVSTVTDLRALRLKQLNLAQVFINMVATCSNREQAETIVNTAVSQLVVFNGINATAKAIIAQWDGTVATYRSRIYAAFDAGVLPSPTPLGINQIIKKTQAVKAGADNAGKREQTRIVDQAIQQAAVDAVNKADPKAKAVVQPTDQLEMEAAARVTAFNKFLLMLVPSARLGLLNDARLEAICREHMQRQIDAIAALNGDKQVIPAPVANVA